MTARDLAGTKAAVANAAEALGANPPVRPLGPAALPGYVAWLVGPEQGGVLVVMPGLRPSAPASLRRRYRARIIANATGRCPRCSATSGVSSTHRAQMAHEADCTATFGARDERWLIRGGTS